MRIFKNKVHLLYIFTGIVILIFMLGVSLTKHAFSSGATAQDNISQTAIKPLRIDNKTGAFEIVDVERLEPRRVRLTLRNKSDKGITAFSLSVGDYSIEPDFFPEMLAPGQTHIETFTLPPVTKHENVVELVSIIFDDQTSEGNSSVVKRMQEYRLGKRLAATVLQPHLQRILNASDRDLLPVLQEVKLVVLNLPRPPDVEPSSETEAGFNTAKDNVLIDFERFQAESQEGCDTECLRDRLLIIKQREHRKVISSTR